MSHLTRAGRYRIAALLQAGLTQVQVAANSRELRRNLPLGGDDPEQAMEQAVQHRYPASSGIRAAWNALAAVRHKVQRKQWSLQAALGQPYKQTRETGVRISIQTVYNHLAALQRPLGRFVKRPRPRGRVEMHGRILSRMPLGRRPRAAAARGRRGDFAADLMSGLLPGRYAIAVVVQHRLRCVRLFLLPNRRAETVNEAIRRAVSECPVRARTLTAGNGKEFARHRELRARTGLRAYCTDPCCTYQRGTVEHISGVLRRKLLGRTTCRQLTKRRLQQAERRINNKPLEVLGFRTPREIYHSCSSPCVSYLTPQGVKRSPGQGTEPARPTAGWPRPATHRKKERKGKPGACIKRRADERKLRGRQIEDSPRSLKQTRGGGYR